MSGLIWLWQQIGGEEIRRRIIVYGWERRAKKPEKKRSVMDIATLAVGSGAVR